MGLKRLLLELIGALLLARFAMAIGGVQAEEGACAQGLPALAAESAIADHQRTECPIAPGEIVSIGGSDGTRR